MLKFLCATSSPASVAESGMLARLPSAGLSTKRLAYLQDDLSEFVSQDKALPWRENSDPSMDWFTTYSFVEEYLSVSIW